MELASTHVLWDMVDGPMPRGLLGVGSGDVVRTDDAWTLYLGGYSTSFRNRLYAATSDPSATPATAKWSLRTGRGGRVRALVDDPPRQAWDGGGMHTPSYLPPTDSTPARIYYAGRRGRQHVGDGSQYAIGLLEYVDGRWRRTGAPLLTGDGERPSTLEPRVVREGDAFVMWYLATPHEVAPGEQPDYELRSATSPNGIDGWSEPSRFSSPAEGFFDVALAKTRSGWTMILAAGTNLHRTTPYPTQGLWCMTAPTASPRRADWSEPVRILDTDDPTTPEWMGAGVCDPAIHISDDGSLTVFVTGTRRYDSWGGLFMRQIRRLRRPPIPAPFFLATGVLTFD